MLFKNLLAILECPLFKSSLYYDQQKQELVCYPDSLAFQIRDGIPLMLDSDARALTPEEV